MCTNHKTENPIRAFCRRLTSDQWHRRNEIIFYVASAVTALEAIATPFDVRTVSYVLSGVVCITALWALAPWLIQWLFFRADDRTSSRGVVVDFFQWFVVISILAGLLFSTTYKREELYAHDMNGQRVSGSIDALERAVERGDQLSIGYNTINYSGQKITWRRQCNFSAIEDDHVHCYVMFVPDTDTWFRRGHSKGAFLFEHYVFRTTGQVLFQKISPAGELQQDIRNKTRGLKWFAEG